MFVWLLWLTGRALAPQAGLGSIPSDHQPFNFPLFHFKVSLKIALFQKQVLNRTIIGSYSSRKTCIHSHGSIGACRAVWVPGQDLAHLMRNCGKLFRHYTIRYTRTSVCAYAIEGGMPRVFASGPLDESTHASK